jgi:hypothetical protein
MPNELLICDIRATIDRLNTTTHTLGDLSGHDLSMCRGSYTRSSDNDGAQTTMAYRAASSEIR